MSERTRERQMWASHLPSLWAALLSTDGSVLEVGAGHMSTPMLRAFCERAERPFTSLEEDEEWAATTGSTLANYDFVLPRLAPTRSWSLVFLDHSGGPRRAGYAELFKPFAEYIVVHDYCGENVAAFAPLIAQYQARMVHFDSRFAPATLTLANVERPWWAIISA